MASNNENIILPTALEEMACFKTLTYLGKSLIEYGLSQGHILRLLQRRVFLCIWKRVPWAMKKVAHYPVMMSPQLASFVLYTPSCPL